jgi:hypothetical protein
VDPEFLNVKWRFEYMPSKNRLDVKTPL